MSTLIASIRRHPLATFFALAYALSWAPSLAEAHSLLPLGPLFAALITLMLADGKRGIADFLRRIGRWRVGLRWYALVLLAPLALLGIAIGLNVLLGARMPTFERMPRLTDLPATFLAIFVLIGLGEEPAWRGLALPRLSARRGVLAGALLLGVLHIIWHAPLFGLEFGWQNSAPWAIGVISYAVISAWLYNCTRGNLLLPALFHTTVNVAAQYLFNPLFGGADLLRLWWLWGGAWAALACMIMLLAGPELAGAPRVTKMDPQLISRSAEA